ncbi:hypothetical protein P7H41_07645 [Vagococcus fluvialis]|uniref:hypothetical protein n=1 Tax=Vagococcus fluvialis TaxID=2738 RepID=UPI0028921310|nr:hypothetical protein [Vagococcus fluvialis]MDT2781819.1 hypothetical protein [Vagococcus fluvialis]
MNKIKSIWIYSLFIFIMSIVVILSWDDYFWASSHGMAQLHNNFEGYNGRYLGNLLIMGITRSVILRVIIYTIINVGIAVIIYKLLEEKVKMEYIIFILLTIPIGIFKQTYGWFSGFANYNISSLFILTIIFLLYKIKFRWYIPLVVFFLAFSSQFFAENVSIVNIIMSFLILLISLFKDRKKAFSAMGWLIGSSIGSWIMFQNAAYHSESDRGLTNIFFSEIYKHLLQDWSELVVKNNVILIILFSIVIYLLLENRKIIGSYLLLFNIYIILRDYLNITYWKSPLYVLIIELVMILIFFGILIYVGFKVLKGADRELYFVTLITGIMMVGPFVVVTPFGPRNILLTYLLLSISLGVLFTNLDLNKPSLVDNIFKKIIIVLSLIIVSLYSINFFEDYRRIQKIKIADKNNQKVVEIRQLPFPFLGQVVDGIFPGDREIEFKEYYNISDRIEIKVVERTMPLSWKQTNY